MKVKKLQISFTLKHDSIDKRISEGCKNFSSLNVSFSIIFSNKKKINKASTKF